MVWIPSSKLLRSALVRNLSDFGGNVDLDCYMAKWRWWSTQRVQFVTKVLDDFIREPKCIEIGAIDGKCVRNASACWQIVSITE
ncbi:MAG: hypothetical protein COB51_04265 [Moraxellaceae bacterium]|nr:MAG: hypothetical protein COB51_04265 [Moraxellaceae bacterium]